MIMSIKQYTKEYLTSVFCKQMQKIIAKHNPKIIAVAGSVGKTSTKMAIATILKEQHSVRYQNGNYNTLLSVPFIFLGINVPSLNSLIGWHKAWRVGQKILKSKYYPQVVVIELGTDHIGELINFKGVLEPDITVVTAVSDEHMEFFGTLDAVAREELSVAEFSKQLVISRDNIDLQYLDKYLPKNTKYITYGFDKSDYQIKVVSHGIDGYKTQIDFNSEKIVTNIKVAARHSLQAACAAVSVANMLGVGIKNIEQGLKKIKPMPGRMQILNGINDSIIIDDTYNSSPLAVKEALNTLYEYKGTQKIAILGMMNELGDTSQVSHEWAGALCDPKKLDLLITLGKDANNYLAPVAAKKGCNVIKVNSPYEAGEILKKEIIHGSVILAKGSQNGVFAEEAIKPILASNADQSKLVRQSKFWLSKKKVQFNK